MRSLVPFAGVAILLLLAVPGWAGPPEDTKVVVQPSPNPTSPWEIKVGAHSWLSFVTGDIGVHGITSHVNVGPNTILRHSNFIAALSGEVRRAIWRNGGLSLPERSRRHLHRRSDFED